MCERESVCTPNGIKTKARRTNGKNAERDVLDMGAVLCLLVLALEVGKRY